MPEDCTCFEAPCMQLQNHGSILPESGKKAIGVGKTDVLDTWEKQQK